jgi:hypothetical protein
MRSTCLAAVCLLAGCATSSSGNYSVKYALAGAANETATLNDAAAEAFRAEATDTQKQESAKIKVFLDSVPPELIVTNSTVGIAPRSNAQLVGSVELTAVWKTPEEAEVTPAIQKAARSVGADLAFCPRAEKTAAHVWRCHLVRTAPPVEAPNTTQM